MKVSTTRFGAQEVDPDKTIFFPNGIAGFEENKHYHIFHENRKNHIVYYLQSIENPDLTLNTVIAEQFGMKYDFTLSKDYRETLGAKSPDNLVSLCIISKTEDENQINAHPDCPIIINTATKRGLQIKAGEVKFDIENKLDNAKAA